MPQPTRRSEALPPPSEQLHLPGPSYQPVALALGTTIAVAGIVINFLIVAVGVIIVVWALVLWIRDAREELAELPLEH